MDLEKIQSFIEDLSEKNQVLSENLEKLNLFQDDIEELKENNSKADHWKEILETYKTHDVKVSFDDLINKKDYKKTLKKIYEKIDQLSKDIIILEEIKNTPEFEKIFEEIKAQLNKFEPYKISKTTMEQFKSWFLKNKSLIQDKNQLQNLKTENMSQNLQVQLIDNDMRKCFNDVNESYLKFCIKSINPETSYEVIENIDKFFAQIIEYIENIQNLTNEDLVFSEKEISAHIQKLIKSKVLKFDKVELNKFYTSLAKVNKKLKEFIKDYWDIKASDRFKENLFEFEGNNLISANLANFYIKEIKKNNNFEGVIDTHKIWYSNLVELTIKIKKLT